MPRTLVMSCLALGAALVATPGAAVAHALPPPLERGALEAVLLVVVVGAVRGGRGAE